MNDTEKGRILKSDGSYERRKEKIAFDESVLSESERKHKEKENPAKFLNSQEYFFELAYKRATLKKKLLKNAFQKNTWQQLRIDDVKLDTIFFTFYKECRK